MRFNPFRAIPLFWDINREIQPLVGVILASILFDYLHRELNAFISFYRFGKGAVLRNASLIAFGLVFLPLIGLTFKAHSANLLWFSLTGYMVALIVVLTH